MKEKSELSTVALTKALPDYGLQAGDVGTIVHKYSGDEAYEVEFVSGLGETLALVQLKSNDVRSLHRHEILHVRALA